MHIGVLVCTRGRAQSVRTTVDSIMALDDDFRLLVVDQSDDHETELELQTNSDGRFEYRRTTTRGKGYALNYGVNELGTDIVLITDDDCDVTSGWISSLEAIFLENPDVGMIFCRVEASEHDPRQGHTPVFLCRGDIRISKITDRRQGIGAGCAVRREAFKDVEGFDVFLGPGGVFQSGDERDFACRLLLRGWRIVTTDRATVIHRGFRTWDELRLHTRRDVLSAGAIWGKLVRHGSRRFMKFPALKISQWSLSGLVSLTNFCRPRDLRLIMWMVWSFFYGFTAPVDPASLRFALSDQEAKRYREKLQL